MHTIECWSGRTGYKRVVDHVLRHGKHRAPRDEMTLDIDNVMIEYHSPLDALPVGVGRGVSAHVAAVEAVQLIGGFHDPQLMTWASPNFAQFMEPTGWFWGAYGQRIGDQTHHVLRKLTNDQHTRQAVITLWSPPLDNQSQRKDYPCTVSLMYALRDDKLCATTVMRSNDAWLGLPYDVFQFTQLQLTLAEALDVYVGPYVHFTHSLHLYRRDLERAESLHDITKVTVPESNVVGISSSGASTVDALTFRSRARRLTYAPYPYELNELTESEKWYAQQLSEFPGRHPAPSFVVPNVDGRRTSDGAA